MSIRLKLTVLFLAIAAIPLLLVSALTYNNFKNTLEANRLTRLVDLSVFRAGSMETYFADLKSDIAVAQGFYNIRKNLPLLTGLAGKPGDPEAVSARKMLAAQLVRMQSVSDMTDIMLVGPGGTTVYANRPGHYAKDFSAGPDVERDAFEKGKTAIHFSDIFRDSAEDNRFEMLVTAPATGFDGRFAGVIAFEVDMTAVYKLVQDATGLGSTGEVLLGRKKGGAVEFLNPLRHDPGAALRREALLGGAAAFPIQQAVQGRTGSGFAIDYRGERVIAAWRYIPAMDWGLVAKIDAREAFADVENLRNLVLMILAVVFLLSAAIAFSIAQSISVPIKKLTEGAQIIGRGNLDHRVGTNLKDEIGQLSRSFDKMTDDLKTTLASRDVLNREIEIRTKSEEALRESEASLKQAQELSHLGNWELDLANNRLTWSDEIYRIFGLLPQEFAATYEAFLEAVHPDDRAAVDAAYSGSVRENRDSYEIEHRVVRKGAGEVRFVHEKCEHFRDESGKIVRSVGMVQDITERKQAEEELRLRTEELKASNEELTFFNRVMTDREERMIELKKQINELCEQLGRPPAYDVDFGEK